MPILSMIFLNSIRHINDLFPGLTFIFEFFLYNSLKIGLYFFNNISIYSIKYFLSRHSSMLHKLLPFIGEIWSFIIISTLPNMESECPFFLNFYYANLTRAYINWNRIKPLSGTSPLPFQSLPDIELVVIKVKSMIFNGVSFDSILVWLQNSVKALLETAQISPLNGLQDEYCR